MNCCPEISWSEVNDNGSVPSLMGETKKIGEDTPIYETKSNVEEATKAIVLFPDVFGPTDRVKSIGDKLASKGYNVVIVDCFRGETAAKNPQANLVEWLSKFTWSTISKDVNVVIDYIVEQGIKRDSIAAIGFCWGGWAIAKSSSQGVLWKCAVSPHPSTKLENMIGGNETEMMSKVNMPFLIMPAGNDPDILKEGSEIVKKLKEKGGNSITFERMIHGWTTRGDLSQHEVKEDVDKALNMALDFIQTVFRSD
jgi:dienelactone hydrolase